MLKSYEGRLPAVLEFAIPTGANTFTLEVTASASRSRSKKKPKTGTGALLEPCILHVFSAAGAWSQCGSSEI